MQKILLICLLLFACRTNAQEKSPVVTIGESQIINSTNLGETRKLQVYTPDRQSGKLPLVIVFDGENLFASTVAAIRFMNYNSEMPQMSEAIVIGIENTDRNRDMPIPQQYGREKGEVIFSKFISEELIPWAAKKFSLNGHFIVIGHSQGGIFASYLLSNRHITFPWVIALDAPMNVSSSTQPIKEAIAKVVGKADNKIRYASINAVYGWENEWEKYLGKSDQVMTVTLTDETHESMAFTGIYTGLKFMYHDFAPARKDMNLQELSGHFQNVSKKYGYDYEIPLQVLTASASRKIQENRKAEILELIEHAEKIYGTNQRLSQLRTRANALTFQPTSVVDSFLTLPKPTAVQISKYTGKWSGQFISKEGEIYSCHIEITFKDGKVRLLTSFDPHKPENKQEPDVLHVDSQGHLVFGIRNRGGGIIINTLRIDDKGLLAGKGMWLGFTIPADVPAEAREKLKFLLTTPTQFLLKRQ